MDFITLYAALSLFYANLRTDPRDADPKNCQKEVIQCVQNSTNNTFKDVYKECTSKQLKK